MKFLTGLAAQFSNVFSKRQRVINFDTKEFFTPAIEYLEILNLDEILFIWVI